MSSTIRNNSISGGMPANTGKPLTNQQAVEDEVRPSTSSISTKNQDFQNSRNENFMNGAGNNNAGSFSIDEINPLKNSHSFDYMGTINMNAVDTSKMDSTAKQTIDSYNIKQQQVNAANVQKQIGENNLAIDLAKQKFADAQARGDQSGMDAAHQEAEAIRASMGYSGGTDGSEVNISNPVLYNKTSNAIKEVSATTPKENAQELLNLKNRASVLEKQVSTYGDPLDAQSLKDTYTRINELESNNENALNLAKADSRLKETGTFNGDYGTLDEYKQSKIKEQAYQDTLKNVASKQALKDADDYVKKYSKKKLESEAEMLGVDVGKYVNSLKGNYIVGRMGQDSSIAWNKYLDNPTPENKAYAEAIDSVLEEFQNKYAGALGADLGGLNWAKEYANYLPQAVDQKKEQLKFEALALPVVFASGGTALGTARQIGATLGSGKYSYETMRGAAFKGLMKMGYDEETAKKFANDEAFISSLIESGSTWLGMAITGSADLLNTFGKEGLKETLATLGESEGKILEEGIGKALFKGVINAGKEGMEERTQEAVSIANENRGKDYIDKGLIGNKVDLARRSIDTYVRLHNLPESSIQLGKKVDLQNTANANLNMLLESNILPNNYKKQLIHLSEKLNKGGEGRLSELEKNQLKEYQELARLDESTEGGIIIALAGGLLPTEFMSTYGEGIASERRSVIADRISDSKTILEKNPADVTSKEKSKLAVTRDNVNSLIKNGSISPESVDTYKRFVNTIDSALGKENTYTDIKPFDITEETVSNNTESTAAQTENSVNNTENSQENVIKTQENDVLMAENAQNVQNSSLNVQNNGVESDVTATEKTVTFPKVGKVKDSYTFSRDYFNDQLNAIANTAPAEAQGFDTGTINKQTGEITLTKYDDFNGNAIPEVVSTFTGTQNEDGSYTWTDTSESNRGKALLDKGNYVPENYQGFDVESAKTTKAQLLASAKENNVRYSVNELETASGIKNLQNRIAKAISLKEEANKPITEYQQGIKKKLGVQNRVVAEDKVVYNIEKRNVNGQRKFFTSVETTDANAEKIGYKAGPFDTREEAVLDLVRAANSIVENPVQAETQNVATENNAAQEQNSVQEQVYNETKQTEGEQNGDEGQQNQRNNARGSRIETSSAEQNIQSEIERSSQSDTLQNQGPGRTDIGSLSVDENSESGLIAKEAKETFTKNHSKDIKNIIELYKSFVDTENATDDEVLNMLMDDAMNGVNPFEAVDSISNAMKPVLDEIETISKSGESLTVREDIRASSVNEEAIKEVATKLEKIIIDENAFAKNGENLVDRVTNYFNSIGGKATNPEIGEIYLSRNGVKSDISHGIGRRKAAAFSAIPVVIEKGRVVAQDSTYGNKKNASYVIAAPVKIGADSGFMGIVVVANQNMDNRLYIHEVIMKKDDGTIFKTKPATSYLSNVPSSNIYSILNRLAKVNDAETTQSIQNVREEISKQLEMNFDIVPNMKTDTVDAVSNIGNNKIADTNMEQSKAKTLAVAFREELINNGSVDITGQTVKSAEDVATIAQVFRDPRFETVRYIFVDKNGKVVLHSAVSSQLATSSSITPRNSNTFLADIANQAKKLNATKLFLLHNHPSGDPTPSVDDMKAIKTIQKRMEHFDIKSTEGVIINSKKYAAFNASGANSVFDLNVDDNLLQPVGNTDLLTSYLTTDSLAVIAKKMQLSKDYSGLLFIGNKLNVKAAQEIPNSLIANEVALTEYVENNLNNFGAMKVAFVTNNRDSYNAVNRLYDIGMAVDNVLVHPDNSIETIFSLNDKSQESAIGSGSADIVKVGEGTNIKYNSTIAELRQENEGLKDSLKDYNNIKKELAKAQAQAEKYKGQLQRTEKPTLRQEDVRKLARGIIKGYSSTVDVDSVTKRLEKLGNFIVQDGEGVLDWDEVKGPAIDIARDIVNNAEQLASAGDQFTLAAIKTYFRNNPIRYDGQDITDWKDFKKDFRGKARFSTTEGLQLDKMWQALNGKWGELFPEGMTDPQEQLEHILEVYDSLDAVYNNPYDGKMAITIENCANEIVRDIIGEGVRQTAPTYADKMNQKLDKAIFKEKEKTREALDKARQSKQEAVAKQKAVDQERLDSKLANVKADNERKMAIQKAEYEGKLDRANWRAEAIEERRQAALATLAQVKAERDEKLEAFKRHLKEKEFNKMWKKAESNARNKLLMLGRRLQNMKTTEANKAEIRRITDQLDLTAKGITNKSIEKLTDLKTWYDDQVKNNENFIRDEHIEKQLERLSKKQISDLDIADVLAYTEALKAIEFQIRTQDKLLETEDKRNTFILGSQIIDDIRNSKGYSGNAKAGEIIHDIRTNGLSPMRFASLVVGYNYDSPLYKAFKDIQNGEVEELDFKRRASEHLKTWQEDAKFMKQIAGKHADEITIKGIENGKEVEVKITPAMRISLYLHALNEKNLKHISEGGVSIPDIKLYKQGDLQRAYDKDRIIRLTKTDIAEICKGMSAKERAYADAIHSYMNDISSKAINETSEKHKGYSIATEPNYFTINTDKGFLKVEFNALKFDGSVENPVFSNERVNSSLPILLLDADRVVQNNINQVSTYVGYAIPVRNFNKLWGVTRLSFNEDGTRKDFESSVQKEMTRQWGSHAVKYIDNLMLDINHSRKGGDGAAEKAYNKIRSNYAGAVLTGNLSVAMKQAASYPTAASVVGWKPLIKAMGNWKKLSVDTINKYTPLLWNRMQGYADSERGEIAERGKHIPKVFNWIQGVDIATTKKLFKAAMYYVQENNKGLAFGSEEFMNEAAKVYNEIIWQTQPNYTTMERPELLRTKDTFVRSVMMFKTQPMQNYNILREALGNANAKRVAYFINGTAEAKAALKEANKSARNAITSNIISNAVFAGMSMAAAILIKGKWKDYEDKDGEINIDGISTKIVKDMLSSEFSMYPLGSEVWSGLTSLLFNDKFYGLEDASVAAINDVLSSGMSLFKEATDLVSKLENGDDIEWKSYMYKLDKFVSLGSKAAGIPYDNVKNIVLSTIMNSAKLTGGEYAGQYVFLKLSKNPDVSSYHADYYDNLWSAYKNDPESYESIYADMISKDFDEKTVLSNMAKRLEKEVDVYEGFTGEAKKIIAETAEVKVNGEKLGGDVKPAVGKPVVKDANGVKYNLGYKDYKQYQQTYNSIFSDIANKVLPYMESDEERETALKTIKTLAEDQATMQALSKIDGAEQLTKYDAFGDLDDADYVMYQVISKPIKDEEGIGTLERQYKIGNAIASLGLSKKDSETLYNTEYTSDKSINAWGNQFGDVKPETILAFKEAVYKADKTNTAVDKTTGNSKANGSMDQNEVERAFELMGLKDNAHDNHIKCLIWDGLGYKKNNKWSAYRQYKN